MTKKIRYIAIFIVLLLSACGGPAPTPPPGTPLPPTLTLAQVDLPGEDLSLGKTATASASISAGPPANAVDGDPETAWMSGAGPEQWIQIDLGAPMTVTGFRLLVSQEEAGQTTHRILAGGSADNLYPAHEFSGTTTDGQELVYTSPLPLRNIQYVRIVTTGSPALVAWREIQVFGEISTITAAPTPVPVADIIYYNGRILTLDPDQPTAEAIAIQDGRILAVGSQAELQAYEGDSTQKIDLQGLTMTPGFIDSHEHRIGDRWHYGNPPVSRVFYEILSEGWTSIYEMWVDSARLDEFVMLDNNNQLPVRVSMYLKMNSEYSRDDWWHAYQPLKQYSPFLQIAGLKITLDREWGQMVFFEQPQLDDMVQDAYTRGWQVATHSFSPVANAMILDAYGKALDGQPNEPTRFRIEHLGVMTDPELARMADLGIIGSVQLIGASAWPDDASFQIYIPPEQTQLSARWRDLIDAGVYLIGNTDAPWCCTDWRHNLAGPSYSPTVPLAIYQGVTRTTFTGRQPEAWQAAQEVTVQEALEMMTIRSAFAAHMENLIGSLTPGKYADMVILSGDPLTVSVEELANIKVVMTMVGGEVKYCLSGYDAVCTATVSP